MKYKKYKLLKELPLYKAGELFHISPNGNLVHTDRGELVYQKNLLKAHPEILEEWFEKIVERPKVELSGQYIPEYRGKYYAICAGRASIVTEYYNYDPMVTEKAAALGLSFETKKECQKFIDRLEAYQILRRDAKGFEPDWKNYAQKKWSGWYDYDLNMLSSGDTLSCQSIGDICFATEEDVRESFENHRKEWLTVLGVEE